MIENYPRAENVRECYLFRDGSATMPQEIFEILYSSLDELIKYNQFIELKNKKIKQPSFSDKQSKQREELLKLFIGCIGEPSLGLTATLNFNNGKKRDFQIKPRTNFDTGLKKRPNIVYLVNENGNPLILREARDYEQDEFIIKSCSKVLGSHYRRDIPSKNLATRVKEVNKNDIVLVSEPNLILSLEQLYAKNIVRRITPHLKIVGASDNKIWYIRNFLPSIRDSHLDMNNLMSYVGTLHGLGLIDKIDSQVAHYCINSKNEIVNIDPDFLTYTQNPKIIDDIDWRDFKLMMESLLPDGKQNLEYRKRRREIRINVQERMENSNILDYLSFDLISSPSLKSLSTSNPFYT